METLKLTRNDGVQSQEQENMGESTMVKTMEQLEADAAQRGEYKGFRDQLRKALTAVHNGEMKRAQILLEVELQMLDEKIEELDNANLY